MFLYLININFLTSMENNYIKIMYLNQEHTILKYISESNNIFTQRLNFIKKAENKNIPWNQALKLSLVWYNINFNKCRYNKELYDLVQSIN